MASGPTLPPQAYTRETLTAAFNWLQTQPDSVRKLATTPDALVGLFVRAQRFGASSLEADAPVSSQNFMSDLKNLAEGLKQFEEPRERTKVATAPPPMAQSYQQNYSFGSGATVQPNSHTNSQHFVPAPAVVAAPSAQFSQPSSNHPPTLTAAFPQPTMPSGLNERTMQMIQEVKNHFNLSSDGEAINMMVALAFKGLKPLIV